MHARAIVMEGMPNAGKTTLTNSLARLGWQVVPEYVADDGRWPSTDNDSAHQYNWVLKERLLGERPRTPVVVDRNFLTALAYAYSVRRQPGQRRLLSERVEWLRRHLTAGSFRHPALYCVLDLDADTSLQRRGREKPSDHPWAQRTVLDELRAFYARMPKGLAELHPDLAVGAGVRVLRLSGADPLDVNAERLEAAAMEPDPCV